MNHIQKAIAQAQMGRYSEEGQNSIWLHPIRKDGSWGKPRRIKFNKPLPAIKQALKELRDSLEGEWLE